VVGTLRPDLLEGEWGAFELDLATLFAAVPDRIVYEDVISFPSVREDIAVIVAEEVPAGDLVQATREAGGAELRDVRVFDVYRGEQLAAGEKSVALALTFQSGEGTLAGDEAGAIRERIVQALTERFGARLRA
jgi:phenylalanyl-tRNA synthetase beta chain